MITKNNSTGNEGFSEGEFLYISIEQTPNCYPVSLLINKSPRHLNTKWELVFWFGDYPIPVRRSNSKTKLIEIRRDILNRSKIKGWKRKRVKSDDPADYEQILKEDL